LRTNLKKFKIDLGLKSKEMAEKLEINSVHYSNIERGKSDPSFGLLQKFEEEFAGQYEDIWELFKKN